MPRVISLIASATEMVAALGKENCLVGRSHECDYPASIKKLPICTEPSINTNGSSREIDQNVKKQVEHGLSVYKVHSNLIKKLNPDVIITQSHCDVCAVSEKDIQKALTELNGLHPKIISLRPNGLSDVWKGFEDVAVGIDAVDVSRPVIQRIRTKMENIASKAEVADARPRVACLEWIDPLMAAGNWVPELIQMAGGENLFGRAKTHSPRMTWDDVVKADPDIILVMPCGFDIDRTRSEMPVLQAHKGWYNLQAVHNNRVFLLDGNQYFNRPGPRLLDSLEILVEVIHPELFDFGHKMTGWQYL